MKKYLITIIIILASITSIYAVSEFLNSNISIDKVTQINLYHNNELKDSYNPKKDDEGNYDAKYNALVTSINDMKETNIDLDILTTSNYKVDIIGSEDLTSYDFNIDLDNLNIYVYIDDQIYLIEKEMSKDLFNSNLFDEIYYDNIVSTSKFSLASDSLSPNKSLDIIYTSPYGFEGKKTFNYTTENRTTITDFEKSNSVKMFFETSPSTILVESYSGNDLLDSHSVNSNEFELLKRDGLTTYKVTTSWENSDSVSFRGDITYTFDIDLDLLPAFELVANNKGAGEFFVIKALYFNDDEKPSVESDSIRNKHFEKIGDQYLLIIPLNYYQKKTTYDVDLYVEKNEEKLLIDTKKLIVENRTFTSQSLTIDKSTVAATSTDNAYAEFAKYFTPSREKSNPSAYFDESFMLPIDGRISTEFGMMRYVNGSLTSYRHSGIDIAVPRGTPVPATNTGKIVLAQELILTGNTVVIDHGVGIFSVYYHMDTLNVSKDDMVNKADIIGTVGSTGRSTGPHLHFTMSFYKTNMNPNFIINLSKEELQNIIE